MIEPVFCVLGNLEFTQKPEASVTVFMIENVTITIPTKITYIFFFEQAVVFPILFGNYTLYSIQYFFPLIFLLFFPPFRTDFNRTRQIMPDPVTVNN